MSSHDAENWLRSHGEAFVQRIGVQPTQCVLDFGCRDGQYTLPAAKVVGPRGCVYAVDKDAEALRTLRRTIRKRRIDNIRMSRVTGSGHLPVPPETVDIALVYDVLHGGYFPEAHERMDLLGQLYVAVKPGGVLSCYLTHIRRYGLTLRQLHGEIRSAGFRLEAKARRKLVHDGNLVRGWIFRYRKVRLRKQRGRPTSVAHEEVHRRRLRHSS